MIVPMKKVSLIVLENQKNQTLKKLRKLGLVHIEMNEIALSVINERKEHITLLENAIYSVGKNKSLEVKKINHFESLNIAKEIDEYKEQIKVFNDERISLLTELERVKNWGDFNPCDIADLSKKGVEIFFYEMPKSEYLKLGDNVKTVKIESTKSLVKCFIIKSGLDGEEDALSSLETYKLKLPKSSTIEIKQKINELDGEIKNLEVKILSYAKFVDSMKSAVKIFEKEVEFEAVSKGMIDENISVNNKNDQTVSYFKGYIENDNVEKLKATAKENSWGLLIEEPCEEDNVPTKLKNNKFVSLIYPLTDFLGTVPGYFEYDISGWFLTFILIFFGIIFGDGGYGLIICLVALIPILKAILSKNKISSTFLLIGLLGLSTVVWGTLTCTWFGLSVEQLPKWLKALSIPVISNVYADKIWSLPWTQNGVGLTTAQNLQILCFTLALIQLTVAHIMGAIRNKKSIKILSDIGSILQLIGIYYLVLNLVVNAKVFSFDLVIAGISIGVIAIALIGVGFILTFVFSNYEGSVMKSILSSLKNIVSVLLGVVNVFSDIVSYIRLWAVGLAGAAISATVNELVGPFFGNFTFMIVAIVLLVFGHGLNMILNVLSVIVHGIRLNTLEFSSHLDMSWSGHKFKPFEE